ncbi:MAG: BatA domain-containing protein [candidate division WOR-3 bacterium]
MHFGAPKFLLLLPLVLIPILLHLIHRMRLRTIDYSSLYFLTSVERKRFNVIQLKEILLLVVRTMFILFLVLSLARPYLLKALGFKKHSVSRVVILDDSYSMRYKNVFSRAKDELQTIANQTTRSSELAIITSSLYINSGFVSDPKKLNLIIDSIKPTYCHNTLAPAFYKALFVLKNAIYSSKELYIITDLQQRAVGELIDLLSNQTTRLNLSREFPFFDDLTIIIIDVGEKNPRNVGIEEVYLTPPLPSLDMQVTLTVKIKNYSDEPTQRTVNLLLNHQDFTTNHRLTSESLLFEEQTQINLGSFETKNLSFNITLNKPGTYKLRVALNRDSLAPDDRYFYLWPIMPKPRVLLVGKSDNDFYYLKLSLASYFEITSITPQELVKENLGQYSVIALSFPQDFSSQELTRIKNYLLGGGALFISCFGESKTEWWKSLGLNFNGFGYLHTGLSGGFVYISRIDTLHPITQIFKSATLNDAKFYSYWALDSSPAQNVLAYFSSGKPFLISLNNGRVIISTAKFSPEYTNFVFKAPFPALMHRIFSVLAQNQLGYIYKIGDTILLPAPTLSPVKITTPKREYFEVPFKAESGSDTRYLIKLTDTQDPGFYQIGNAHFAINVLPDEGNLNRGSLSDLKKHKLKVIPAITERETDLTFLMFLISLGFVILELIILLK